MAVSYFSDCITCPSSFSKPAPNYFLYTPCNCPVGDHLRQQSDGLFSKPKRYKTTRRIRYLAHPRWVRTKFSRHAVVPRRQETEIVRSYKEPYASRRIQQLALPRVRNLIAVHQEYRQLLERWRQEQLKKKMKQSSLTIYSQLAGVELPKIRDAKFMSPDDWQRHKDWLELNALPKKLPAPCREKRKQKPLTVLLVRLESLAAPRYTRRKITKKELANLKKIPSVKPAALKATASEHVLKLAEPIERRRRAKGIQVEDTRIPESVLKMQASDRLLELAVPKRYTKVNNEYRDNPFTVEPNALKAKASDRVQELAKPKAKK
ncbi:testicular haploid expressed gene protein-like [Anopheles bellator]|uniref:testicular haploid expressed gene protein-like n=1 Tax=Anopheles bellator TaxID=139047 RepID=UPI00264A02B4|nr:testicular haploid expressed gene protein-like [Anopheles bellator]